MLTEVTPLETVSLPLPRPLVRELSADLETPTTVYLKLSGAGPSFLLESVERGEQIGRYTFLGARPYMQVQARGENVVLERGKRKERRRGNAVQIIKELLRQHRPAVLAG